MNLKSRYSSNPYLLDHMDSNYEKQKEISVVLIYDYIGSEWHNRAQAIKDNITHPDIQIAIDNLDSISKYSKFDFIVYFAPYWLSKLAPIPPEKRIIGSANPVEVRYLEQILQQGLAYGGFVNSNWQYQFLSNREAYYLPNGVDNDFFHPVAKVLNEFKACWAYNPNTFQNTEREILEKGVNFADIKLDIAQFVPFSKNSSNLKNRELRRSIYHKSSCYICLSRFEGTPNTGLEALACGLPIISTPVGNLQDIIVDGYNGFLIDRKADELQSALNRLQKANWKQISLNARKMVIDNWKWSDQLPKYEQMFLDLWHKRNCEGKTKIHALTGSEVQKQYNLLLAMDNFFHLKRNYRQEEKEILGNEWSNSIKSPARYNSEISKISSLNSKSIHSLLCQNIDSNSVIKEINDSNLFTSTFNDANVSCKNITWEKANKYSRTIRVMFYFFKNVHIPILLPILKKWKKTFPSTDIALGYMFPAKHIRAGLDHYELKQIKNLGLPIYEQPQLFQPDLTFIADSVYPWVHGCGKLVHVGHGLLSKGQYYTNTPIARREQDADLVCVPGKHHQHVLRQIISKPVIATGMAKLDPLFSGKTTRSSVLRKYGLPENYKYVLFAPTFNDELSAIPYVLDNIAQVLPDSKTILLIKLHGSTKTEYKQRYQRLPTKDKRVVYIDELNITPFLALADVMVSDVSSAMFEFAALDKPVVLFDSPDWSKYVNYNPGDIEFTWRNFALRAGNLEELKIGVKRSLDYPDEYSGLRRQYTKKLLANHKDGNAAERIVKSAYSIIGKTLQISYLDQAHIKNEANI